MTVTFYKYHALGNDYLVIDPQKTPCDLTPDKIRLICHRNYGVGSDGILLGPIIDPDKKMRLRILNPDGGEAEKSGNGIRIFSRYLLDQGYVTREHPVTLATLGGDVTVEFLNNSSLIKVDMGSALFESTLIPVTGPSREILNEDLLLGDKSYPITCVSMGNPHCVIPMTSVSEETARFLGPLVENHQNFPNRINMQLLEVIDKNNIRIEIWERGAGYTLASGSSSCAAASAAYKLGLTNPSVTVHMPGGQLKIEIEPTGHVMMTGPVTAVARGTLDSGII